MKDITEILGEGFGTVEGKVAVLNLIKSMSDDSTDLLCSGYGVFPDGRKCEGCRDCME